MGFGRFASRLLVGAAALAWSADLCPAHAEGRPNVLLVLADDLGYSDISPFGGEIFTPHLARLAAQGTMFTNFHVAAYCAPTRSMMLTGADNHRTGLGNMVELLADNQRGQPGYEGRLNGRAETLATRFRDAGYRTVMAGKWHLGKTDDTVPAAQGFDRSVGLLEGGADNFENKSYTPGYKSVHYFDGLKPLDLPPDFYSTKFYADRMIDYIDESVRDGKPFFGFLALQAPHQPHQAPPEFTARYVSTYAAGWSAIARFRYERMVGLGLVPPGLPAWRSPVAEDWNALAPEAQRLNAKRMAVYAGMVEYMDMSIGRVLDHLQAQGTLDDTVVVFASDNGGEAAQLQAMFPDYYRQHFDTSYERLGEKGSYSEYGPGWASVSMTPFSNYKGSAAEGGVRAPFIIRYPRLVPQGGRADQFAYVLDVVPTLLDLAGVPAGEGGEALPGRSMAPMLAGKSPVVHPGDESIGYEAAGGAALYRGDHKLVRSVPPYGDAKWRLFDLRADPAESRDLTAAEPGLARDMADAYERYKQRNGVVEVPDGYNVIAQARENASLSN